MKTINGGKTDDKLANIIVPMVELCIIKHIKILDYNSCIHIIYNIFE